MMSLAYAINDFFPIKKESSLALKLKGDMNFSKASINTLHHRGSNSPKITQIPLPHYNTKDLILSTQNSILTQALEKIGEFNYTQESNRSSLSWR